VILQAGSAPVVLTKRDEVSNVTLVYMATTLAEDETDWPTDPSFPIFFSKLLESMRPAGGTGSVMRWNVSEPAGQAAGELRRVNLVPWLAITALVMIVLVGTSADTARNHKSVICFKPVPLGARANGPSFAPTFTSTPHERPRARAPGGGGLELTLTLDLPQMCVPHT